MVEATAAAIATAEDVAESADDGDQHSTDREVQALMEHERADEAEEGKGEDREPGQQRRHDAAGARLEPEVDHCGW